MVPTIEDLFEFMRKDKEERAKEREKDKQELKELISQGVQNEVRSLLNPLEKRVQGMEDSHENVMKKLEDMQKQMKNFSVQLETQGKESIRPIEAVKHHVRGNTSDISQEGGEAEKITELISLARRTVGLYRIDSSDLDRMRQQQFGGAKTEDEEKHLAVQEYLRCELKIGNDIQEGMEVEEIFSAYGENPAHLYVTYKEESSVSRIFEKTRIMRKESRILNYIPRQFKERARAIGEIEYKLRKEQNFQTRIKMGLNDLELWKKIKGMNGRWERVALPGNLPKIDLNSPVIGLESTSPPPGRPDSQGGKRGRESTGSESGKKNSKNARNELDESSADIIVEDFSEKVKKANLVGEATISPTKHGEGLHKNPDHGTVFSVTGMAAKHTIVVEDYPGSPILSKSTRRQSNFY